MTTEVLKYSRWRQKDWWQRGRKGAWPNWPLLALTMEGSSEPRKKGRFWKLEKAKEQIALESIQKGTESFWHLDLSPETRVGLLISKTLYTFIVFKPLSLRQLVTAAIENQTDIIHIFTFYEDTIDFKKWKMPQTLLARGLRSFIWELAPRSRLSHCIPHHNK